MSQGAAVAGRARQTLRRRISLLDVVFAIALVATFAWYLLLARTSTFLSDDWLLALRGRTPGDYLQPYNDHLSIVPIAVYHALYQVFGFRHHLPLLVVGIASLTAISGAVFLTVRSRFGSTPALVAALAMLWYPGTDLEPAAFNHYLALLAVYFCAWQLTREGPEADLPLAIGLTFALCSSGVSVAGAAGCLAFLALSRPRLRRWLAVLVPSAGWVAWRLLIARSSHVLQPRSFSGDVDFVRTGLMRSFDGLVGGNHVLGILLALAFVINLGWQLRRGLRAARHQLAWTFALVCWWAGLAISRGLLISVDAFRYSLIGSAFVILAALPAEAPTELPEWLSEVPAVALAILLSGLLLVANRSGIVSQAHDLEAATTHVEQEWIAANLGPTVVPDATPVQLGGLVSRPAGVFRELVHRYGAPSGTRPTRPDAALVALARLAPRHPSRLAGGVCSAFSNPSEVAADARLRLGAPTEDVAVRVRRFGDAWVRIGRIRKGTEAQINLAALLSTVPWQVSAPGACQVRT